MPSLPAKLLAMWQSSNFGECYITANYANFFDSTSRTRNLSNHLQKKCPTSAVSLITTGVGCDLRGLMRHSSRKYPQQLCEFLLRLSRISPAAQFPILLARSGGY